MHELQGNTRIFRIQPYKLIKFRQDAFTLAFARNFIPFFAKTCWDLPGNQLKIPKTSKNSFF